MAETNRAVVNPELLVWARESAGISIDLAARRLKVKAERLRTWEEGSSHPTIKQLWACSKFYRRPLGVFFFSTPPPLPLDIHDFRHLPSVDDATKGHLVRFEVRRARQTRSTFMELLGLSDSGKDSVSIQTQDNEDVVTASDRIRGFLGLTAEVQFSWRDSREALRAWIHAIERHGVLVLQCSHIPSSVMRGFSVYYPTMPVIVLNGGEAPNGRIFTLLHEFAHLLLRNTGLCDTIEYRGASSSNQSIERFCNALSASTLVPGETFTTQFSNKIRRSGTEWINTLLEPASRRFRVSKQVILGRLHDLKFIDTSEYFGRLDELKADFQQAQDAGTSSKPRGDYYRTQVRNCGYAFTNMVIEAHYKGVLTTLDTCKHLDIKMKSLPGIERAITGQK